MVLAARTNALQACLTAPLSRNARGRADRDEKHYDDKPEMSITVGYISPSTINIPSELDVLLPEQLSVVASVLDVRAHTDEQFRAAREKLDDAVQALVADGAQAVVVDGVPVAVWDG